MKFCSGCGSSDIEHKIPEGDNRLRHCCPRCDTVYYENPKIVTGCLALWKDKVLLCKRAIEPRTGTWTLPAGFMENHETLQEAAARETFEEATARTSHLELFAIYDLPHISQVYVMFRAKVLDGEASPGIESLETEFVDEENIPWPDLSFPIITETLKLYFEDRKQNNFSLHTGEIIRNHERAIQITRY